MKKYKDLVDGDIVLAEQVPEGATEEERKHGLLQKLPSGFWKLSNLAGKPFNYAPADATFKKDFAPVEDEKPSKKSKEELT